MSSKWRAVLRISNPGAHIDAHIRVGTFGPIWATTRANLQSMETDLHPCTA